MYEFTFELTADDRQKYKDLIEQHKDAAKTESLMSDELRRLTKLEKRKDRDGKLVMKIAALMTEYNELPTIEIKHELDDLSAQLEEIDSSQNDCKRQMSELKISIANAKDDQSRYKKELNFFRAELMTKNRTPAIPGDLLDSLALMLYSQNSKVTLAESTIRKKVDELLFGNPDISLQEELLFRFKGVDSVLDEMATRAVLCGAKNKKAA